MGTTIKSEADLNKDQPTEKRGLDEKQLQASGQGSQGPIKTEETVILQGEAQTPLPAVGKKAVEDMTDEELKAYLVDRASRKARIATLLERGMISDRLTVELPPDLHGEWARNDPLEIQRLRTLGFEVDTHYAPARALHNDGTGSAVVGDVVFMTTSRENKELIDEIRHDQFIASNSPRKAKEEKDFEELVQKGTGGQIPAFTDSKQRVARKAEISAALLEVDAQTKPVK